jgi:hypothetical protein
VGYNKEVKLERMGVEEITWRGEDREKWQRERAWHCMATLGLMKIGIF